ncbi:hypothetical protein QYE76_047288 [Lolium multiflorum]|uniref:Ubiquitin-like domain-containing protein n=1 Tax=Lolium multiflorum TaxID=4521 RepID=A0AAD8TPK0_LOLMU|nr:hypothetical protein QYE76_047288 [Lolium multiflorum]
MDPITIVMTHGHEFAVPSSEVPFNYMTADDYGIMPIMHVRLSTTICVVADALSLGYPIALDTVDAYDMVARVKMLLEQSPHAEGKLPAHRTSLLYKGVEMEDDKTLKSSGPGDPRQCRVRDQADEDGVEVVARCQPAAARPTSRSPAQSVGLPSLTLPSTCMRRAPSCSGARSPLTWPWPTPYASLRSPSSNARSPSRCARRRRQCNTGE